MARKLYPRCVFLAACNVRVFDWDDALVAGRPIPPGLLAAQMDSPRYPVHYVNDNPREPTLAQLWHNIWFWKYVGQTVSAYDRSRQTIGF